MTRTAFLKTILSQHGVHADMVSKNRKGEYIVRKGYFYTHGRSAQNFLAEVEKALIDVRVDFRITDYGDRFAAFRGGASVASQSHWYVVIHFPTKEGTR